MSVTLADVLTSLAYRLGEDQSPSDANEKARRVRFINEAYRKVIIRAYWWFTEASADFNSVANQANYDTTDGFPSDYRDMIELRLDDKVYTYIPQSKVFGLYDSTMQIFNYDDLISNKHWYVFDNTLTLLPTPTTSGTDNIVMKYWKFPTSVTTDAGTFLIPDQFIDCLDAYAYARIAQLDTMRGDAADGLSEFNSIMEDMMVENNRRKIFNKSARVIPNDFIVD